MLKILGVSRNGYFSFIRKIPSKQEMRKEKLKQRITKIYEESHQNYGAPKISKILAAEGESVSEKTVGNYMREIGIKAQYVKPYTKTTKNPDFSSELKNILEEQFRPEKPNAVWCSDITYIWTQEGFVYLTSIMNLYLRKIISWKLLESLETKWVVECITQAKKARDVKKPLIFHSDREIQYVSREYREATDGWVRSYSKKGISMG